MIFFNNIDNSIPYKKIENFYKKALSQNEQLLDSIVISSYDKKTNEVDSRFVNLKCIENTKFIFYSNYNSPKSLQFASHDQISAVIYWPTINLQVRIKAIIKRLPKKKSDIYFKERNKEKNALAISSNQSNIIESYKHVEEKFHNTLTKANLLVRPEYWGGFSFEPYYFEFWEGHEIRINKREAFSLVKNKWLSFTLEP